MDWEEIAEGHWFHAESGTHCVDVEARDKCSKCKGTGRRGRGRCGSCYGLGEGPHRYHIALVDGFLVRNHGVGRSLATAKAIQVRKRDPGTVMGFDPRVTGLDCREVEFYSPAGLPCNL